MARAKKFTDGQEKAIERLSGIAYYYSMTVIMPNLVRESNGCQCAGKITISSDNGVLSNQIDNTKEGILILGTKTKEVLYRVLLPFDYQKIRYG